MNKYNKNLKAETKEKLGSEIPDESEEEKSEPLVDVTHTIDDNDTER